MSSDVVVVIIVVVAVISSHDSTVVHLFILYMAPLLWINIYECQRSMNVTEIIRIFN